MVAERASDDLVYTVRRSARARHARLTVTADGEVVAVLPRSAPLSVADAMVERHRSWVERQLRRGQERRAHLAARPPLAGGRVLMIGGVPHRLIVEAPHGDSQRGRVEAHRLVTDAGIEGILVMRPGADGRGVLELLDAWLRADARRVLSERVAAFAPVVGVSPTGLSVRDQRSRWGSASRSGRVSLSWRLILTPPSVLDYVVIHELAHLRVAGHPPRFWALVRRHAPQTDTARRWLRDHHAELLAALD